jgi:hypothetical protein
MRMPAAGPICSSLIATDIAFALEHIENAARSFDAGVRTESLRARWPLRMRVSISPRGSVKAIS